LVVSLIDLIDWALMEDKRKRIINGKYLTSEMFYCFHYTLNGRISSFGWENNFSPERADFSGTDLARLFL
jgi:hypothetical protein